MTINEPLNKTEEFSAKVKYINLRDNRNGK